MSKSKAEQIKLVTIVMYIVSALMGLLLFSNVFFWSLGITYFWVIIILSLFLIYNMVNDENFVYDHENQFNDPVIGKMLFIWLCICFIASGSYITLFAYLITESGLKWVLHIDKDKRSGENNE